MMYTTMEELYRWEIKDITSKLAASPEEHFSEDSQKFSIAIGANNVDSKLTLRCLKSRPHHKDKMYLEIFLNIEIGLKPLGSNQHKNIIDMRNFHLRVENNDFSNLVIQGSPGSTYDWGNGDIAHTWNEILQFREDESFDAEEFLRGSVIITLMLKKKIATVSIDNTAAAGDTCVMEKLCGMIAKLENDEKNSDVKIVSSDGQEFFAYRWILAEASSVFEAMFRLDMTEKETGIVKFEDLSGATVKLLLHFIYTQKIGEEWSTLGIVEELVYAADNYQIEDLKNFLDANLGKVCTAENAGNLLSLVDKTSMKKAMADILTFIKDQLKDPEGFFEIVKNTKINKLNNFI